MCTSFFLPFLPWVDYFVVLLPRISKNRSCTVYQGVWPFLSWHDYFFVPCALPRLGINPWCRMYQGLWAYLGMFTSLYLVLLSRLNINPWCRVYIDLLDLLDLLTLACCVGFGLMSIFAYELAIPTNVVCSKSSQNRPQKVTKSNQMLTLIIIIFYTSC